MSDDADSKQPSFKFSREIRLGDLITVLGVGVATIAAWQKVDFRLDVVERAQAQQAITNKEIRQDIREVSFANTSDLKDLRGDVRRIETKIDRARL